MLFRKEKINHSKYVLRCMWSRIMLFIHKYLRIMAFDSFLKELFRANYTNNVAITSVIATVTQSNQGYPIRCIVQFGFVRNNQLSGLDISLDFNRNSLMGQHTMTSNFKHSTETFNIDHFTPNEIAIIFTDIPALMRGVEPAIIAEYNRLYP